MNIKLVATLEHGKHEVMKTCALADNTLIRLATASILPAVRRDVLQGRISEHWFELVELLKR